MDDSLTLYRRASDWTAEKVSGAVDQLEAPTPDDEWNVRMLLNHMIETQRYFAGAARGEDVSPPSRQPPSLIGSDPADDFEMAAGLRDRSRVVGLVRPRVGVEFDHRAGPALLSEGGRRGGTKGEQARSHRHR